MIFSLQLFIQAALSDSDIVPNVRDDNYDTCAVFTPVLSFPWFYDFSIPVYYWNAPGTVAVELVGDNIGCSLGNDAKFFIFPVSTWSDATGVSGLRSTCIFYEATVAKGTRLQKCVYTCRYTRDTIALRVIRLPYNKIHSSWKLCEVSNIFYDTQQGLTSMKLTKEELIMEVTLFSDIEKSYTSMNNVVGIRFSTNKGHSYGVYGHETPKSFTLKGQGLLYFYGLCGSYIDAIGAQFGEC
ncbi:hypothetical protein LSH36_180g05015 [Paralvinella palmiformis]|uniref:Jacalin-type lectin domain-containing protein n=1 Tax=Paralvinella palmiformis TaxID=53620 RepID=A0AAD9JRA6_9ANNE|nr:hypothetical protein LSH36_180g05015 [Paralvinella palmiformis]